MDTLPKLYPNVADFLATPAEDLVPLLLNLAQSAIQNGIFAPDSVNDIATEANNIHRDRPAYTIVDRREIHALLNEAWAIIEAERLIVPAPGINGTNGFRMFTKRGAAISNEHDFKRLREAAAFPKVLLHPSIADKVSQDLMRGDEADAVFFAFKTVEEAVRGASGLHDVDGAKLMRRAFDKDAGPLTNLGDRDSERDALPHLFAGAIGCFRNPAAHRTIPMTRREAQDQVLLASHLLRIVDVRRTPQGGPAT